LIIVTVLGGLSSAVYKVTIIFVIGNFVTMQSFVEWENYLLKKSQIQTNKSPMSVKKLGIVSVLVILVGCLHIYIMFFVPNHSKNLTFHLGKVF
jgi:cytochrome b subunit of formate dehydrogenase